MILYKYEPSIEVAEYERDFVPLADSFIVYPNRRYDYPGPLYQFVRISYTYTYVYIYIHTYSIDITNMIS